MRRVWKYCISLCLMACLFLGAGRMAQAEAEEQPESSGSIELHISELGEGVEITLYQIGKLEYDTYKYTEDFGGAGISIADLEDDHEAQAAAESFAAYAAEHQIEGIRKGTVDAQGILRFEGLEPALYLTVQTDGVYIQEVQPALIPIPYYVGGSQGESYDAVIPAKNSFAGGAVIVSKVSERGEALAEAQFVLQRKTYLMDDGAAPEGVETGNDENGNYYWKQFDVPLITNQKGQIAVKDLERGEYRFVEVTAPEGFLLSKTVYPFTIEKGGSLKESEDVYAADGGTVEMLEAVNYPIRLKINKVDEKGSPVEGAVLVLKDAEGKVICNEDGTPKYQFTTSKEPYELLQLPAGDYYVSEVKAPAGYKTAADVKVTVSGEEGMVNEVTMVDEREETEPEKASFVVKKKAVTGAGAEFVLANAEFYAALFEDEACTKRVSDVQPLVYKGSAESSVTFTGLTPGAVYYVGETDSSGTLLEQGVIDGAAYTAEYPNGRRVQLAAGNAGTEFTFRNVFKEVPGESSTEEETNTDSGKKNGGSGSSSGGSSSGGGSGVKTGDTTPIVFFAVLLAAAAAVIAALSVKVLKRPGGRK